AEALPAHVARALEARGVDSSSTLRLRLFDLVNRVYAGFVPSVSRDEALAQLAEALGLTSSDVPALERALILDAEEEAVLQDGRVSGLGSRVSGVTERDAGCGDRDAGTGTREPGRGTRAAGTDNPEAGSGNGALGGRDAGTGNSELGTRAEVVGRYNRSLLAAMLRGATRIIVTVHAPTGGLLRRLYALCHRLGVYCDVEQDLSGKDVFRLTLAGPDAVVGPPAVAGPRLAIVSLRLLRQLGPADHAEAHLVLRDRHYRLLLDRALLRLPGLGQEADEADSSQLSALSPRPSAVSYQPSEPGYSNLSGTVHEQNEVASSETRDPRPETRPVTPETRDPRPETRPVFDSGVEERLARDFGVLRRQRRAMGWRLVREPAPLLAGSRVLLPDFALVRGDLTIFVEVAGFWTPGYLTKKRQALEQLPATTPLIMAVVETSLETFAGLPFPVIPYRDTVPVAELFATAEARFGDFAARTSGAADRLTQGCAEAEASGWLAEEQLAGLLGGYGGGGVVRVLSGLRLPAGWDNIAGAGLCGSRLRASLTIALEQAWTGAGAAVGLSLAELRARLPDTVLPESDGALALVLEHLPVCSVARSSLFSLIVQPRATPSSQAAEVDGVIGEQERRMGPDQDPEIATEQPSIASAAETLDPPARRPRRPRRTAAGRPSLF
ncbi:MAG: DUF790 family protein, partial [Dehalococcoidia bacterium]